MATKNFILQVEKGELKYNIAGTYNATILCSPR